AACVDIIRNNRAFFLQAEDGIRDRNVTGVQTCALPIYKVIRAMNSFSEPRYKADVLKVETPVNMNYVEGLGDKEVVYTQKEAAQIGRASCREREEIVVEGGGVHRRQGGTGRRGRRSGDE